MLMGMVDWGVESGVMGEGRDRYGDLVDGKMMGWLVGAASVM